MPTHRTLELVLSVLQRADAPQSVEAVAAAAGLSPPVAAECLLRLVNLDLAKRARKRRFTLN